MPFCESCGSELTLGSQFCTSCGTPVNQPESAGASVATQNCPACGSPDAAGTEFCTSCGWRLTRNSVESQVAPYVEQNKLLTNLFLVLQILAALTILTILVGSVSEHSYHFVAFWITRWLTVLGLGVMLVLAATKKITNSEFSSFSLGLFLAALVLPSIDLSTISIFGHGLFWHDTADLATFLFGLAGASIAAICLSIDSRVAWRFDSPLLPFLFCAAFLSILAIAFSFGHTFGSAVSLFHWDRFSELVQWSISIVGLLAAVGALAIRQKRIGLFLLLGLVAAQLVAPVLFVIASLDRSSGSFWATAAVLHVLALGLLVGLFFLRHAIVVESDSQPSAITSTVTMRSRAIVIAIPVIAALFLVIAGTGVWALSSGAAGIFAGSGFGGLGSGATGTSGTSGSSNTSGSNNSGSSGSTNSGSNVTPTTSGFDGGTTGSNGFSGTS